jgi:hypothetical protein
MSEKVEDAQRDGDGHAAGNDRHGRRHERAEHEQESHQSDRQRP